MKPLALADTYEDVIVAIRARCNELGIPYEVVDDIAGLPDRYTSKILAPQPTKGLGRISWAILEALGMRVVLVENRAALKKAQHNHMWHQRQHPMHAFARMVLFPWLIRSENAREMANKRWSTTSARRRKRAARKAAKARWRKPRLEEITGDAEPPAMPSPATRGVSRQVPAPLAAPNGRQAGAIRRRARRPRIVSPGRS